MKGPIKKTSAQLTKRTVRLICVANAVNIEVLRQLNLI